MVFLAETAFLRHKIKGILLRQDYGGQKKTKSKNNERHCDER